MPDENSPLLEASAGLCEDVEQDEEHPRRSSLVDILPLAISTFLVAMNRTIIVTWYTSMGNEFKQLQNSSWIVTAYLLTLTTFQPLYRKLSNIFGRKTCLLLAHIIFGVGCTLSALSRNFTELLASRAFTGIGGGGIRTLVCIVLSDHIPLRSRGTSQGVVDAIWAAGNTCGAALGGFLADTIGWRAAFLIQLPMIFTAIGSVLTLQLPIKRSEDFMTMFKRVDFGGSIALLMTALSLLYGLNRGGTISWYDPLTIMSILAAAVSFSLLSFIETNLAREPIFPKRIITDRGLIPSYFANMFSTASSFSVVFHLPLFWQGVQGKSATESGLWLSICAVGAVLGSLAGGMCVQATGKYYSVTLWGYSLLLGGTMVLALSTGIPCEWLSDVGIAAGLFMTSFGNASGISTSLIAIIANAGSEDHAMATNVSYLFRSLGYLMGLSVGNTIVQSVLRTSLQKKLSGIDVDEIARHARESLEYLNELDPATVLLVRESYGEAVQMSLWFSVVFAILCVIASRFIREKDIG